MTTKEIADRFYELATQGQYEQIYKELYSEDVKSIEPENSGMPSVQGMDAIRQKGAQFNEQIQEVHGGYTNPPAVAGNFFCLTMGIDSTSKKGERTMMDEVCVYEVKDGKIVSEQFFF